MSAPARPRGPVITFYSYKGGTGRTMALANVACLFAEQASRRPVLVVDWDLEAPGLHRFFPSRLASGGADPELGLDHRPGLIDLFLELEAKTPPSEPASDDDAEARAVAALDAVGLDRFIVDTTVPDLRLLRAGRGDDGRYSQRVNTFDWEGLFRRSPDLFRLFAERLSAEYGAVLIDSRTGLTDISGICTCLLPEKLVVVFTPNRQSVSGIATLVQRATTYRLQSDDLRPLMVFPLPSRIEASRDDLRSQWRVGDRERGIQGYQPMFEELFVATYGLAQCSLKMYFDQVQIQQSPNYAYGEDIAVRIEQAADRFSLTDSYRVVADWLLHAPAPWTRQEAVDQIFAALKERLRTDQPAAGGEQPPQRERELEELVDKLQATVVREVAAGQERQEVARAERSGPGEGGAEIFLSYASVDRGHAERLATQLEALGTTVWWDRRVLAGQQFDRVVEEALDRARVVIVLWSAGSVSSEWVKSEAAEAARRGVIVPAILDDARIPLEFRRYQAVDLRSWARTGASQDLPAELVALSRGPARPPTEEAIAMPGTGAELSAPAIPDSVVQQPAPRSPSPSGRRRRAAIAAGTLGVLVLLGTWYWRALPPPVTTAPPVVSHIPDPSPPSATAPHDGGGTRADVTVPTVVGRNLSAALEAIGKAGLTAGQITAREVADAQPGIILGQSPGPGAVVPPNSAVSVTIAAPRSDKAPKPR